MNNLIESIVVSIQNNIALVLIILGILIVTYTISLAVIFAKVGNKARYAFIPIYNLMTLLSILRIPKWMVLIMVLPFVNIIGFLFMNILIGYKLGVLCRKNFLMKFGLMFFSPVFYPLLAFTDIDVDGSKLDYVIEKPKDIEFKLDPVEVTAPTDAPEAMNLSFAENVDKITIKKLKPTVEIKKVDENVSVEEHLAKANKARPTAQDLTFDYNLIYNSKPKEKIVEEVQKLPEIKEESKIAPKINVQPSEEKKVEIVEEVVAEEPEEIEEDVPFVPIVHEITLEEASPLSARDIGPVPLNQRYEQQMKANKDKITRIKEAELAKAKEIEEDIKEDVVVPTVIIDNGPINLESSISGLMAAAPDFNAPIKEKKVETKKDPLVEEMLVKVPVNTPVQTTEVQEIVSMNIVEPDQLPVKTIPKQEKKEEPQNKPDENVAVIEPVIKTLEPQYKRSTFINYAQPAEPLLRPVGGSNMEAQNDKICPACDAKMRRDCPVCLICGYHFIE